MSVLKLIVSSTPNRTVPTQVTNQAQTLHPPTMYSKTSVVLVARFHFGIGVSIFLRILVLVLVIVVTFS